MRKNINTIKEKDIILWVNISLIGIVSLLFLYYVMTANSIASKNYKVQVLRDKIESLAEANSSLMSKKSSLENPVALVEFAQAKQLVEARNIFYIFEGKNVARR